MNIRNLLDEKITAALAAAGAPEGSLALVGQSARPELGDYQANGVMAAAKKAKANPRELAAKVLAQLSAGGAADISDIAEKLDIAGPGFINIRLKPEFLAGRAGEMLADARLGAATPEKPQTVVVDYSSPNLAKEMHVGHLRSTIIGDALARAIEFVGHKVIRQNHVGDWGTQFGMLIAYLKNLLAKDPQGKLADSDLADLEDFYRKARSKFDSDPAFADAARQEVVALQGGDEQTRAMWQRFIEVSLHHCEEVYEKLNITLRREHLRGESAYNADLPRVVEDLGKLGLLTESQGAQCVFLPEFVGKDGTPLPVIVQKKDEGFLYATSDLAAMRHRAVQLHADRILYVVGAPQALHFRQVFAVARKAGFVPENVSMEHIAFGTMMGSDGKPFKTRSGGTVKLMDLLDEAVSRAAELVKQKQEAEKARAAEAGQSYDEMPPEQVREISEAVGVGAVKYSDLSQNRNSDYVFSWEKMLSMDGNTAPYMQYAYARIKSIFRKGGLGDDVQAGQMVLSEAAERNLALKLAQFSEAIATLVADGLPNVLCAYLFELAGAFTTFYENCPVLKSDEPVRTSRLKLSLLTGRVIRQGLELLGIRTIEQM